MTTATTGKGSHNHHQVQNRKQALNGEELQCEYTSVCRETQERAPALDKIIDHVVNGQI